MWREGAWRAPGWRPERPTAIADALDALLDQLEARYDEPFVLPPDPLPLSSGFAALDRVCGGGLRLGAATVVEADQPAQGRALLCTIARAIEHPSLLVTADPVSATTRWLLAGACAVPEVLLRDGGLSEDDWRSIAAEIVDLAERPLQLGQAGSPHGVEALAARGAATVVLVGDLERLGEPVEVVLALDSLAARTGVAVLATGAPLPVELTRGPAAPGRVSMSAHGLAGRAALVGLDDDDGLVAAQVEVDVLGAAVR